MSETCEYEEDISPVTAISFLETSGRIFTLCGHGPFLEVLHHDTGFSVFKKRVFRSQSIHGIAIEEADALSSTKVLLWGGRLVRLGRITLEEPTLPSKGLPAINVGLEDENRMPDWVLYGCFSPPAGMPKTTSHRLSAVLVTAHNSLIVATDTHISSRPKFMKVTSDTRSLLYSAHCVWLSRERVLVASGTVFGEILVSSCDVGRAGELDEEERGTLWLHEVFRGHEGSIFGVQLSPELPGLSHHSGCRLLASCSDDRTIRVWDVSSYASRNLERDSTTCHHDISKGDTGFGGSNQPSASSSSSSAGSLAQTWAHASRIWAVRFIVNSFFGLRGKTELGLLSFGEDATCQLWQLLPSSERLGASDESHSWRLSHRRTLAPHTGKNLWSGEVYCASSGKAVLATGGSDGRVASVVLQNGKQEQKAIHEFNVEKAQLRPHQTFDEEESPLAGTTKAVESGNPLVLTPAEMTECNQLRSILESPTEPTNSRSISFSGQKIYSFKCYSLMSTTSLIAVTNIGVLLRGLIVSPKPKENRLGEASALKEQEDGYLLHWTRIAYVEALRGYSVICSCPGEQLALCGTASGIVYYYWSDASECLPLFEGNGKISDILCHRIRPGLMAVLICWLNSPKVDYLHIDTYVLQKTSSSSQAMITSCLELPSYFFVTALLELHDHIIIGSRNGALAFYYRNSEQDPPDQDPRLASCFRKFHHAEDAVTSIIQIPVPDLEQSCPYILTTAKDGTFAIHRLSLPRHISTPSTAICCERVHRSSLPFGPNVEGAHFDHCGDLILHGFRGRDFVVWNETRQSELMTVNCGSAHRYWDFHPSYDGSGGGTFTWTQASKLRLHTQARSQHSILANGGHGREIKAVAICPRFAASSTHGTPLIATGAEDTVIRIFTAATSESRPRDHLMSNATLRGHITGIQHLHWSDCGRYLFSSASNEELFVWRVSEIPAIRVGVVREAACPPASEFSGLRVMSFAATSLDGHTSKNDGCPVGFLLSACYSDSSVRIYIYDTTSKIFEFLSEGIYTSCCLTHIFHYVVEGKIFLITAGTDGYIAFWTTSDSHQSDHQRTLPSGKNPSLTTWTHRTKIHQNTVTSMLMIPHPNHPNTLILITGGDDNAIGLTLAAFHASSSAADVDTVTTSSLLIPKAHACAVTALAPLSTSSTSSPSHAEDITAESKIRFASCGNDQRLKLWHLTFDNDPARNSGIDGVGVRCVRTACTAVADVSSMDVIRDHARNDNHTLGNHEEGETHRLVICGVGMEVWRVGGRGMVREGT